tara:strand:+ start:485 stop:682 length:198 start_codon:yes stop_codon:yes gene_type:complete
MKSDAERYGSPICYDEKEVGKIVDEAWDRGYNAGYKEGVEMAQDAIKRHFKVVVDNGLLEAKNNA